MRPSSGENDFLDWRTARSTRFTVTAIDAEKTKEPAAFAERVDVVIRARAVLCDRFGKHRLHFPDDAQSVLFGKCTESSRWPDSRAVARFVRINVTDTGDRRLVE